MTKIGLLLLRIVTAVTFLAGMCTRALSNNLVGVPDILLISTPGDINARSYRSVFQTFGFPLRETGPDGPFHLEGAEIVVVPLQSARLLTPAKVGEILASVRTGAFLITDGKSELATRSGICFGPVDVTVAAITDNQFPSVQISWADAARYTEFVPPEDASILATVDLSGKPVAVEFPLDSGRVFFLGTELDAATGEGYARFPYFFYWLSGRAPVRPVLRDPRLEVLFDPGYRPGVDLDYLAGKWRSYGITAVHVAAWHFYDRRRDDYLSDLIRAAHSNGILVYAWLELPHVSDGFWQAHTGCREKNALLEDAPALWRQNVNLLDETCFSEAMGGTDSLLDAFDWDGVNVAELYFESPQGPSMPQKFTPMNTVVRNDFQRRTGFDPVRFFEAGETNWQTNSLWPKFVEYRAELVARLHALVLQALGSVKRRKPYLDIGVTSIDNLIEPKMKEACGSDVSKLEPLRKQYGFQLLLEDPYSVWQLGPERYRRIAEMYAAAAYVPADLGIDINVVKRISRPTQQQTGMELLRMFHHAGASFGRVVMYLEGTVYRQDFPYVSQAMAARTDIQPSADGIHIRTQRPVLVEMRSATEIPLLDGNATPFVDGAQVLVPAGKHLLTASRTARRPPIQLTRLNADLRSWTATSSSVRFAYSSRARAIAVLDRQPRTVHMDGQKVSGPLLHHYGKYALILPNGTHDVVLSSR